MLILEATRCGTASMASATTVAAPRPKRGGSIAPSHYWGRRSVPYANRRAALRCSFPPRSAATLFFRLHRHCWGCRLVAPDDLVVVAAELSLLRRVCLSSSSPRLDCASLHLLPVSTMPFRRRGCSCAALHCRECVVETTGSLPNKRDSGGEVQQASRRLSSLAYH